MSVPSLNNFGSEGQDLHVILVAQLTSHRPKDTGASGVLVVLDEDGGVVVAIEDRVAHPLYKKIVGRTYKLKAHDEQNACGVGDVVKVMETRPLSKDKRWRVVEIVEKAK